LTGNWKYNLNYWTGGAQRDCKGQWTWCAGADKVTLSQSLNWAYNQPDNKAGGDDCIHMKLLQNTTGIVLSDRNCSDKYIVACEVRYIATSFCSQKYQQISNRVNRRWKSAPSQTAWTSAGKKMFDT
jgi:hypothetical protein